MEGKQRRPINDRPCVWMPLLMTTMVTMAMAMVTEAVAVVMKTTVVTQTQQPTKIGSERNVGDGSGSNGR